MDILIELFSLVNIDISCKEDLYNIEIEFDTFKRNDIIDKFYQKIPNYKKQYNSNMLTCLHMNSIEKQKFPALNFLRQILKCNHLKLKGHYINLGNDKTTGKKLLKRIYKIIDFDVPVHPHVPPTPEVHQEF
jgi:hypothetical protein